LAPACLPLARTSLFGKNIAINKMIRVVANEFFVEAILYPMLQWTMQGKPHENNNFPNGILTKYM